MIEPHCDACARGDAEFAKLRSASDRYEWTADGRALPTAAERAKAKAAQAKRRKAKPRLGGGMRDPRFGL